MADERIDSYIDRAGLKKDTDFLLEQLNIVTSAFEKVNNVKVNPLNGVGASKATFDAITQLTNAINQQNVAVQKAIELSKMEAKSPDSELNRHPRA